MPQSWAKKRADSANRNKNGNHNTAEVNDNTKYERKHAKSRKQVESEEFERDLADLSRATAAAGMQRAKKHGQGDKTWKEQQKKHKDFTTKKNGIEEQFGMMLRRQQHQQQFQELMEQLLATQRVIMDAPNTDFHGEVVTSNPHFDVAVGEMQGWRVHMEDEHLVDVTFPDGSAESKEGLFSVFDGHSGKACATKCREFMSTVAKAHSTRAEGSTYFTVDFEKVYLEVDSLLAKELTDASGCTAVTVHVTPEYITCASVGDSRAVLCRNGAAFDLSHDHKPENALERLRIEGAGGKVLDNRVNGQLAMSRAMGDFQYKAQSGLGVMEQLVIPLPDVICTPREADDKFIVLACDGIFDVLSNEELISRVCIKKHENKSNLIICEEICRECLAPPMENSGQTSRMEGTDNMTIIIVDLI